MPRDVLAPERLADQVDALVQLAVMHDEQGRAALEFYSELVTVYEDV